ncbi:IPT/TIG domain-containing protein [Niabella sp.]|uniref:IPT/TIG domain-containing protein n=1 Tax=Niabella sp. TaxID=1962976 RepID=UPI002635E182|nr:IPT/TIG domain-containing protein [Niabella sp.]
MKPIIKGLVVLMILMATACKKDTSFEHNGNAPITVDQFTPASGGAGTEVLLYGTNFSKHINEVSVMVNGVKAYVEGTVEDRILIVIPRKAGSGKIEVTINGRSVTSKTDFNYLPSSVVSTLAGTGTAGFADGAGRLASFNFSARCGLDVDADGNLFVADPGNRRVRKIAPDGTVTSIAGSGNYGYKEGKGDEAEFYLPFDVVTDPTTGNLYVSDPEAWTVRRITPDGTTSRVCWGEAWGLGIDKRNGMVYYANTSSGTIVQVTPDGSTKDIATGFNYPSDVTVDQQGNLYVVEHGKSVIWKLKADTWERTLIAGQAGVTGLVNGTGAAAKFDMPWAITVDKNGNLYIAGNGTWDGSGSNSNQCIRRITAGTWEVSTYIGGSTAGFADGTGSAALFYAPTGVTVDKNGVVYVLDRNNQRVRKVITE